MAELLKKLLKEVQLAEQLNLSPVTLKAWRNQGRGPKFIKFPGKKPGSTYSVRYKQEDVDAWLGQNIIVKQALAVQREVRAANQPSPRAKRKRGSPSGPDTKLDKIKMRYVSSIPRKLQDGLVLVHNRVIPHRVLGVRGFRAWTQKLTDNLERCSCDWADGLVHYRVKVSP
jgi:hypothetical protein